MENLTKYLGEDTLKSWIFYRFYESWNVNRFAFLQSKRLKKMIS